MNNELDITRLIDERRTGWLGTSIHYVPTIGSTNDQLKQMVRQGADGGTVVVTDFQSAGKGRLRRSWEAPPNSSLLLSVLIRPNWTHERVNWLTMIAGLAITDAIQALTGIEAQLKWPNDVVIVAADGTWHKVAGILLESEFEGDQLVAVIIGMGINVNITADEMPEGRVKPTSLQVVQGEPVDRVALLGELLVRLEQWIDSAEAGQSPHTAWNQRLITLGKRVQVAGGNGAIVGNAEGCDELGQLLVRDDAGELHTIVAGDVTVLLA
jgi:BirA family biotin operon repressor/biotin-[acetyl-CoA-carboxylase] ligase